MGETANPEQTFSLTWEVAEHHSARLTRAEIETRFGVTPEELGKDPYIDVALDCGGEKLRAIDSALAQMEDIDTRDYRTGSTITGVDEDED